MKKTPIKRKPSTLVRKHIKRAIAKRGTAVKRKKKTPIAKLKAELWELCKQLTRLKYGNTCYTCGKEGLSGSTQQTGHFIPSSICGGYLRYDLRNLRIQCYRCNIDLSGNGAVFYRSLVRDHGQNYVDALFADKERLTKLTPAFLEEKIAEYTEILKVESVLDLVDKQIGRAVTRLGQR